MDNTTFNIIESAILIYLQGAFKPTKPFSLKMSLDFGSKEVEPRFQIVSQYLRELFS